MEHAHCDDALVKRIPSPDGRLSIAIYNRSCSAGTGLYTYAAVEETRSALLWSRPNVVCYLVTLGGGYHQLDAVWKDAHHIEVSSPEELENEYAIVSREETCENISIGYQLKVKSSQTLVDPNNLKCAPAQ